ncbi:unnamed protein product [Caenorhabditis bovis]|uniref:Uncharacterized protein n=1 Tax=Caenorhabditis bovis TaxID=2654633 RepID=A0A8S1FB37_9PELO|nr:unnamed protein product [Caenorhabditis bovis]
MGEPGQLNCTIYQNDIDQIKKNDINSLRNLIKNFLNEHGYHEYLISTDSANVRRTCKTEDSEDVRPLNVKSEPEFREDLESERLPAADINETGFASVKPEPHTDIPMEPTVSTSVPESNYDYLQPINNTCETEVEPVEFCDQTSHEDEDDFPEMAISLKMARASLLDTCESIFKHQARNMLEDSNWSRFVQVNIYGKSLAELRDNGVNLEYVLENVGCSKLWIGEVSMYHGESDSGVDSSFEDTVPILSTTIADKNVPRISTPKHSYLQRKLTFNATHAISCINSSDEDDSHLFATTIEDEESNSSVVKRPEQEKVSDSVHVVLEEILDSVSRPPLQAPNLVSSKTGVNKKAKKTLTRMDTAPPEVPEVEIQHWSVKHSPIKRTTSAIKKRSTKAMRIQKHQSCDIALNELGVPKNEVSMRIANYRDDYDPYVGSVKEYRDLTPVSSDAEPRNQLDFDIDNDAGNSGSSFMTCYNFTENSTNMEKDYGIEPQNAYIDDTLQIDEDFFDFDDVDDGDDEENEGRNSPHPDAAVPKPILSKRTSSQRKSGTRKKVVSFAAPDCAEMMTAEEYKRHVNEIHTIKCQFPNCKKTYRWKIKYGKLRLIDHALTHVGRKTLKCRMCDATTFTTRSMRHHYAVMHKSTKIKGYGMKDLFSMPVDDQVSVRDMWIECYKDKLSLLGEAATTTKLKRIRRRRVLGDQSDSAASSGAEEDAPPPANDYFYSSITVAKMEFAEIQSAHSIDDLRAILQQTPTPSFASTPTRRISSSPLANNMEMYPVITEEGPAPRFERRLSRCLTELRPGPVEIPSHHRRFSLFRPNPIAHRNRSLSGDFTNAWLRTSNFDVRDEPVEINLETEPESMGAAKKTDTETAIFEDIIERPNKLERSDSASSSEENSENGSVSINEIERTTESAETTWMRNENAKNSMITAGTVFYALFLTIFSLVLELAHLVNDEESRKLNKKDIIFGLYMYCGSIVFFFYMYVVLLLNPRWYVTMGYLKKLFHVFSPPKPSPSTDTLSSAVATIRKVTHSSPSAGSLFLRLGCIVFGVIGVVYNAFLVFLCNWEPNCSALSTSLDVCAIVFIFIQMHFIFCNWKISITGSHLVARIGTMHLVAANLWTWIRYVLMEEGVMEREIREVFQRGHHSKHDSSESTEHDHEVFSQNGSCKAVECFLGSLSEVMYTSIVEYSLIAAAVMYIVWRNIGKKQHGTTYVKRKHQIRVDCSKTTTGLFLGIAFLAITFTSMVVYYGYNMMKKSYEAAYVYAFTDLFQYVFSTIGCLIAIYQMRALKYFSKKTNPSNRDQELLDQILLSIGLIGELIYSVAGLVGLTGEKTWTFFPWVLLTVHIFRLFQVGVQTFFLHVSRSVRMGSHHRDAQPGKQAVTFLLTANLALFFMNLFESEKAGVSETIINYYGKRSWVFLVRSFSPLTIFYRFHSSVCLAEIWKNVYASKTLGTPTNVSI